MKNEIKIISLLWRIKPNLYHPLLIDSSYAIRVWYDVEKVIYLNEDLIPVGHDSIQQAQKWYVLSYKIKDKVVDPELIYDYITKLRYNENQFGKTMNAKIRYGKLDGITNYITASEFI